MNSCTPGQIARVCVVVALGALLGACATTGTAGPEAMTRERAEALLAPDSTNSAIDRLAALASQERSAPAEPTDAPGLAARLGLDHLESPDESERAGLGFDEAARRLLAAGADQNPAPSALDLATPDDRETAAYLVTLARGHIDRGEMNQAIEALARAADLDPSNAAVSTAQMHAMLAEGRRAEAVAAARRSIAHDGVSADAAVLVALEPTALGDTDAGAFERLLAALSRPDALGPEPRSLGAIAAGEALIERGWLRAGGESILSGLEQLPQPTAGSPWRADLVRALGRATELRLQAGDAFARVGAFDSAFRAYGIEEGNGADPRALFALVRTGRPASAAFRVIERVRTQGSPPTTGEIAVLGATSRDRGLSGVVAGALMEARSGFGRGSQTVRAELVRAAAGVLGPRDGADLLRAHLAVDTPNPALIADLLDLTTSLRARVRETIALTRLRPEHARRLGAGLLASPSRPIDIAAQLDSEPGWAASLLAAGVDLQRHLPRRALTILEGIDDPDAPRDAVDQLLAEAGAESGRWDVADAALGRLAGNPEADPTRVLNALRAAQRLDEAYTLVELIVTERAPEVESFLLASELALQRNEPRDAELFLQTAGELDPFDERVYAAQLALYGAGGPLPDDSQQTRVRRLLREHRPDGVLAELYDANDLAEGGLLDEADARLRAIIDREPDEPGAYELLLRVWSMRARSGAPDADAAFEDAATWLGDALAARPSSPPVGAALARVLVALGRPDEALDTIDAINRGVGAPVLSIMQEQIIARELEDPDRARELALARLGHPTLSIDDSISRAGLAAESRDATAALATLERGLPGSAELTPEQRARVARVAALSIASLDPDEWDEESFAERVAPSIAIIDVAAARGAPLSTAVQDARLSLSALDTHASPDDLAALIHRVVAIDRTRETAAYRLLARSLLDRQRTRDAAELSVIGAVRGDHFDEALLIDAVQYAGQYGNADVTRALLDRLDSSGRSLDAVGTIWDEAPPDGVDARGVHAEIAYQVASIASIVERDEAAEGAYRVALEQDPSHTWSNNDLGYMLADAGRDLDEAERMIELAYEHAPESSNVTDSLGWIRYKKALYEDEDGREGAITLLIRAISLDDGSSNATLHDHLGDALWRAGRRDEAEDAWLDAEEAGGSLIRTVRRQGGNSPAAQRLEARRRSVRAKLLAVQSGEEPPVAPIGEDPPDE